MAGLTDDLCVQNANGRSGSCWIQTYTGRKFYPLDPVAEDLDLLDIAQALSNVCRYAGHCPFYSVAQHSLIVSQMLPSELQLCGLLHDASEAYLGDITRPLKQQLPDYRVYETRLQECISRRFGVPWPIPREVDVADRLALAWERRDLMKPTGDAWVALEGVQLGPEHSAEIQPWSPIRAKHAFLEQFLVLGGRLQP